MAVHRLLLQSTLLSVALASRCYYTDGTFGLPEQQPCFPEKENSACCGIAKTNGDENDYCLTSGLCLGQVSGYTGFMLLNTCTDSSWESDDCPNYCPSSMRASHGIHILPCLEESNSHWCCSVDGSDCCDKAFELDIGKLMAPGPGGNWTEPTSVINPPSSTSAGTIDSISNLQTATRTVTVTADPTADLNSDPASIPETCDDATCSDNTTAVVGVGVGLGVALVVCLASSAAALCFQRRTFKKRLEETRASFLASGYLPAPHAQAELYAARARPPIAELPTTKAPRVYEM
ncbi:hypothetical protein BJY04DRAFT_182054 [Aspergillus karnatakaensis]|uniref:uncharacterized protein n=1 Tax=Aspergillus karnatakaensis TaxID=1810916 RepID=UPI003CCE15BF